MSIYWVLFVIIEVLAVLSALAAWRTRDSRLSFLLGFNTLLPVVAIIAWFAVGKVWRRWMAFAAVLLYLARMDWILVAWFGATAAAKMTNEYSLRALVLMAFVMPNVFGWLYTLPFWWWCDRKAPFDAFDTVAIVFYAVGTLLHFFADYSKYRFKQNPENRGKLLRSGLWGICRHPNYFGDFLIYFSFAVASASFWGLIAPIVNVAQYCTDAIPKSETWAREKYGDEWTAYASDVKCFVPFVY